MTHTKQKNTDHQELCRVYAEIEITVTKSTNKYNFLEVFLKENN